jgi:hypothetical protein
MLFSVNRLSIIASIFFFLFALNLNAQRFETLAVLGINASQIDGDTHGGFNKLGLSGGLKTIYELNGGWAAGLELLFSQRGSQAELVFGSSGFQSKIHLNYIEIPIYGMYQLLYDEEMDSYGLSFHAGISYARLLNVTVSDDSQYSALLEGFKDNDISYVFGASYAFSKRLAVTGRFTRAFTYLFKDPRPGLDFDSLQGFFLTFRLEYKF